MKSKLDNNSIYSPQTVSNILKRETFMNSDIPEMVIVDDSAKNNEEKSFEDEFMQ